MGPKFHVSAPTLISAFSHILSFALKPFLTRFVLTHISFTFPATLALIQLATTAVCLWFWSVFGLYRVRPLPLRSLLPLAFSAATLALLAIFTLAKSSLLVFQTARLLSATAVLAVRTRSPLTLLLALFSAVLLIAPNGPDLINLITPLCYIFFAVANLLIVHPIAATTKASELQLQVLLRALAAVLLLPAALLLDDYTDSPASIRNFPFDDTTTIMVFSTGLIAFFSFTASRAAINTLTPYIHNCLLLAANLAVFASHFLTSDDHFGTLQMAGVFGLSAAWSHLAEKRRRWVEECDEQEEGQREAV